MKTYNSDRKKLLESGFFIENEARNIACPFETIPDDLIESVEKLMSIGFSVQRTTFEQSKLF